MDSDKPGYIGTFPADKYQELIREITKAPKIEDIEKINSRLDEIDKKLKMLDSLTSQDLDFKCKLLYKLCGRIVDLAPIHNAEVDTYLEYLKNEWELTP